MATSLTLRGVKGTPLTHAELDANLTALRDTADAAVPSTGGSIFADSTSPALLINQIGTGACLVVEDSASPDATPFVVAADGRQFIGDTVTRATIAQSTAVSPFLQITGTAIADSSQGWYRWQNAQSARPNLILSKSRASSRGNHVVVLDNDHLGGITFTGSDGTAFVQAVEVRVEVDGTPAAGDVPGRLIFATSPTGTSTPVDRVRIASNGLTTFLYKFGYGTRTGVGGAVTQATSKATGVTLNTVTGAITTAADALAASTTVSFTLTNSEIEANDNIIIHRKSGGTAAAYQVWVDSVAAGSCVICIRNTTGGSLSEAVVLQFSVVRGAIA
jgi:hypothetical protein